MRGCLSIIKLGATSYHPLGTCKMGSDAMAVVDHQLRVHGVKAAVAASLARSCPDAQASAVERGSCSRSRPARD